MSRVIIEPWRNPGPADVLGFSYGGGIAMRVAEQHPDVVRRLILASTTAYRDYAGERAAPDDPEAVLRTCPGPVLQGAREVAYPVSLARRLNAALPSSTLAEVPEAARMAHFDNPRAWLAGIRAFLRLPQ